MDSNYNAVGLPKERSRVHRRSKKPPYVFSNLVPMYSARSNQVAPLFKQDQSTRRLPAMQTHTAVHTQAAANQISSRHGFRAKLRAAMRENSVRERRGHQCCSQPMAFKGPEVFAVRLEQQISIPSRGPPSVDFGKTDRNSARNAHGCGRHSGLPTWASLCSIETV